MKTQNFCFEWKNMGDNIQGEVMAYKVHYQCNERSGPSMDESCRSGRSCNAGKTEQFYSRMQEKENFRLRV